LCDGDRLSRAQNDIGLRNRITLIHAFYQATLVSLAAQSRNIRRCVRSQF
jgi:hypothetical protein